MKTTTYKIVKVMRAGIQPQKTGNQNLKIIFQNVPYKAYSSVLQNT